MPSPTVPAAPAFPDDPAAPRPSDDPAAPADGTVAWRDAPDTPIDRDGPTTPFTPFDPDRGPETPILELVAARAAAAPDHVAVRDEHSGLGYRALLAHAASLAAAIAEAVPAGRPVGVRLADTADYPMALLACLAASTPAVMLDPSDPPDRLARMAADSRLAAVVATEPLPGQRVLAPRGHPPCDARAPAWPARRLAQDAPAFVVWTSGSSGQPKGIVHSQRGALHRAGLLVNSGHLGPSDQYLSLNGPASMGGLLNALAAWLAGATLHRAPLASLGLGGVLRRIRERRVTATIGVPAVYRALARRDAARASLASLRLLSSQGEALLASDLALLRACLPPGCHIQMVYGATETQAGMRFVPAAEIPAGAQVAAGRPIPGTRFAILSEGVEGGDVGRENPGRDEGSPAPDGAPGALLVASRYTAIGEWRDGGCVPGRMLPEGEPGAGWRRYAMGDVVRLRADGALLVLGRADRQLKLNGHRVEPVELEAALRCDPGVVEAAVLPVPGPAGHELVGFVATGHASDPALRARLDALLAARLAAPMRPRRLHLLAELPMLAGNKVDAQALLRLDQAALPRLPADARAPPPPGAGR